jgi:ADP-ribose pyrophosphatase YjhB (NUDIX family)
MPIPEFIASLRAKVGADLLLVPTVAILARDADDRLLLVQDVESDLWGCPAGIVEPDESPADAAVRETWEESAVHVALNAVAGVFGGSRCRRTYPNGDRLAWVATVFHARALSGTPRGDGVETRDARFFSARDVAALPLKASTRGFLDALAAGATGSYFAPATWTPARR